MTVTQYNNPALFERYARLSQLEKYMVRILALQINEVSPAYLMRWIHDLGFRDANRQVFQSKTFWPILESLKAQGLIHQSPKGLTCAEAVWREALLDILTVERFTAFVGRLLTITSGRGGFRLQFATFKEVLRDILCAIYNGASPTAIERLYQEGLRRFPQAFLKSRPFLLLFNQPFRGELLDLLPKNTRWNVLSYLLKEAFETLAPIQEVLEYALERLDDAPSNKERLEVCRIQLWRGDVLRLGQVLFRLTETSPSEYTFWALQGWNDLLQNHPSAAITHFTAALKSLRAVSGKRNHFFSSFEGVFFLLALLKSDQARYYEEALKHIEHVALNSAAFFCGAQMVALESVFRERLGRPSVARQTRHVNALKQGIQHGPPAVTFFSLLILSWIDPASAQTALDTLNTLHQQAARAGLTWLEAETAALLATLDTSRHAHAEKARQLHERLQTTSLVDLVVIRPQWEKVLRSLIHIGASHIPPSDTAASPAEPPQRLIWLLAYSEHYHTATITPRLQARGKRGQWTKGRPVALKTLRAEYATLAGLTEQDHEVCRTIVEDISSSGYRRYSNITWQFDYNRTLPALVGHPRVFLADSLTSPIELVRGEPEVQLRRSKEGWRLTLHPMPDQHSSIRVCVIQETPSRFKVVVFSPHHEQIARSLAHTDLKLPSDAEALAGQAMTALAALVPITSDLPVAINAQEPMQEVSADPTPHAYLMPWQNGVKIQFLVRPFPQTGSHYRPGQGGRNVLADIDGQKVQATRDLEAETARLNAVLAACPTLQQIEAAQGEWLLENPADALEVLLELKNCGNGLIMEWPQGETFRVRNQASFDQLHLQFKKERDWFTATGALQVDDTLKIDLRRLMELLDTPVGRFITLDDGSFVALTEALRARLEELRAYTSPHGKGLRLAPLAAPALEELTSQAGSLRSDRAWKAHCQKLRETVSPEVPSTLQAQLRPYQVQGYQWLAQLAHWEVGACLADDMGLGKTVQALAVILQGAAQGPTLVVAPLSVISNWQQECRTFAPTLTPRLFGPGDRDAFLNELQPFDLVISSYGLLQTEAEKLARVHWQTVVLDEAQAIKNRQTKRSQAAMQLTARFRLVTTGTPVENHLEELWTLFQFINPGLLGSLSHFREQFVIPIEQQQDRKASQRLQKLIRPFILRRLKSDVLQELPAKTEMVLQVEMSPQEALLYEALRLKALKTIEQAGDDQPGAKHLRILAELTKLRQVCCHASLILPDTAVPSSKHKVFMDVVTDLLASNHKALVFSQFVKHLALLRKLLDEHGIVYQYLDGRTTSSERAARIRAFQRGEGDLFLISLKAGGLGLNLTAADYVIHMDPWWNPAVEDQASDRAHRIGQTRPVTVYRLVMKDTIEEQIVKLHQEKRELAETLLAGTEAVGRLSAEELLALLQRPASDRVFDGQAA